MGVGRNFLSFGMAGWYDGSGANQVNSFLDMRQHGGNELSREGQHLMLGPWPHAQDFPSTNLGDFNLDNSGGFVFFSGLRLGISAESLTNQLAEFFGVKDGRGVLVASVNDNSTAARAGRLRSWV